MDKKLYRSPRKMVAGVCAGLGEYLGVDPTVIRLLWLIAVIAFGTGLIIYLAAWLIIPLRQDYF